MNVFTIEGRQGKAKVMESLMNDFPSENTAEDEYWIVFKNGEYVSGTDEFGYPLHTKDRNKAFKFYDFNTAMSFFNLGYSVIKN